jgi:hypothetical protein
VSDDDVWWKPILPLVNNKGKQSPPPIPQRNPLRLLRRFSRSPPKGFGENVRGSRNIRNLHLDLSRLSKGDVRNSLKNSIPGRRRSQGPTPKEKSKLASKEGRPNLAIPGHILNAMRDPEQSVERSTKVGDYKDVRWSTRTSTPPRTPYTNAVDRSGYAEQLVGARGHTRTASDPVHSGGERFGNPSKWDASMPSHECIRRSCISSVANEPKTKRPAQALAINKKLPPLPAAVEEP